MKRRTNPVAVIAMFVIVIAAIILAFFIKSALPAEFAKWKDIIFWGILVGGAGLGGVICGKYLNRRR